MTRKSLVAVICASLLLVLILIAVNKENISFAFSQERGITLLEHQSINNIIDFYVDQSGNYYYLDYYKSATYLYKVTLAGDLVFKKKLPDTAMNTQNYYKKIIVDENENIYVSVTVTPQGSRNILREVIQKFDRDGNYIADIYEIILKEPMRMGNPFTALGGRLINLQLINEKMYAFDKRAEDEIALLEIDLGQGVGRATDKTIINLPTSVLREIIYTVNGEIYFLNRQANIYRVNQYNFVEMIDTSYDGFVNVIPYTLSTDEWGHLYFTDVYNEKFVKLYHFNHNPQVVMDLSQVLDAANNITLNDLRSIKYFNDNTIAGHSRIGTEGNYFATLQDGTGIVMDNVQLSFSMAVKAYGLWVILIFAGVLLTVILIKVILGKIGLLTKQILIFLPLFLTVMLSLVLVLANTAKEVTLESAYENVASLAEVTANLMDSEKFKNLNYPQDDFGPEYTDIVQQVRVNRDGIYYVTYFVENNRIFVGVSTSIQSYTPIEYLYDQQTVQVYYDTLQTGQVHLGSTIDSFGEWMFALAPIQDANGQIIGILEHGLHGGQINDDINAAAKNLIMLMVGIALAVGVAYMIMLKYSLRALNVLKLSVAEIAAGRWDTKVDIRTKDEFRDIGLAFNKMSGHIQEYIDEITKLNKAYLKFVPEEFFTLLGKKNVLDVQLGEQVMEKMTIMYVNIRNIQEQAKKMDVQENYLFINKTLEVIARTINENQGVIERFEGAGAIALFKNSPEQALVSSLKLLEELSRYNRQSDRRIELGITINSGQILLGIVGYEHRLATTVIADELHNTHLLEKISAIYGIKLLLTHPSMDELTSPEKYLYRYVGRVKDNSSPNTIEIYEFLDGYGQDEKNVKLMTKSTLEKGIAYYQAGNFIEARKNFIQVIRVDREDKLARAYLFLCEKYNQQELSQWEGVLEYF